MISLSHTGKRPETSKGFGQEGFQPIFVNTKLPREVSPRKEKKYIQQINRQPITNSKMPTNKNQSNSLRAASQTNQKKNNTQQIWSEGGAVRGAFDKNLKKNQLAAEERRIRAEIRKQKELNHQEIIINQKKIAKKGVQMAHEKDQEIQYLQKMIQKEKQEKEQIDREYERRKQEIQKERQQLLELERRIQKEGIKEKQVIREVKSIARSPRNNEAGYGSKHAERVQKQQRNYSPPTQSETLHQKNTLRQQQLQMLMTQRENCVRQQPNINYTPTLIPLLSRASYKIVSTHVSQIVELLVDEMLEEQVYLLEEIELQEKRQRQQEKEKEALNEYYGLLDDLAEENDQIARRVGNYSAMSFEDVYKPKHYPRKTEESRSPKAELLKMISLADMDQDRVEEIVNRKDRFIRFVSNFDEYKKNNTKMFDACVEELIDEAVQKLALELDKGSGEFVNMVFRNEFN